MITIDLDIERKLKVAMSVAEMARAVGMTRARFYQLIKAGIFPPPSYSIETRQPMYVEEQQRAILVSRRRNCGVDGTPILFRGRASALAPAPRLSRTRTSARLQATTFCRHVHLVEPLRSLGLDGIDGAAVDAAVAAVFPGGIAGNEEGDVIRRVFLHLRQALAR